MQQGPYGSSVWEQLVTPCIAGVAGKTISLMDVSVPSFWRGEVMQYGGGETMILPFQPRCDA